MEPTSALPSHEMQTETKIKSLVHGQTEGFQKATQRSDLTTLTSTQAVLLQV